MRTKDMLLAASRRRFMANVGAIGAGLWLGSKPRIAKAATSYSVTKIAGAATQNSSGDDVDWVDLINVTDEGDTPPNAAGLEEDLRRGEGSNDIIATGFDFDIPTTATIDAIFVKFRPRGIYISGSGAVYANWIQLTKDGISGTGGHLADWTDCDLLDGAWPAVWNSDVHTAPDSCDTIDALWDTTWNPAEINPDVATGDDDFGALLACTGPYSLKRFRGEVDWIKIQVDYTD